MVYGKKDCHKPCPKPCPKCPKQQIKLVSADWKSAKHCPKACFKISKKFACQKATLEAIAETFDGKCKDTFKTCEKVFIDECGCFCIAIPDCTVALCLRLSVKAPPCDCHYGGHGKVKELCGLFNCATDTGKPHKPHKPCYDDDSYDYGDYHSDQEYGYDY